MWCSAPASIRQHGVIRLRQWSSRHYKQIIAATLFAAIGLAIVGFSSTPRRAAVFTAIDVGQGDALVLQTRRGQVMLIDGGSSPEYLGRLQKQIGLFRRRIDLMILTHPHDDHLNGLVNALERFDVGIAVWTGVLADSPAYKQFRHLLARLVPDRRQIATAGQEFEIDGGRIRILWPVVSQEGVTFASSASETTGGLNDTSIVSLIDIDGMRILSMGDASTAVEQKLLGTSSLAPVDILVVGHHGSRFSTSPEFAAAVKPKIAIISVGEKNDYQQPAQSVIARLERVGARVLRTDRDGTVSIDLIAGKLVVRTGRH